MKTKLISLLKRLTELRIFQHILFWVFSFRVLLEVFAGSSDRTSIDSIYTVIFMVTLIFPVYINLYFCIPFLLSKRKYSLFTLSLAILILGFALLNQFTFNYLTDLILPDYYFISYYDFEDIVKFFLVFIFISSLLKLSKAWFFLTETKQKLSEAERQKLDNELKALKSQLNPHFMFNSLNNIYSLSLKKSDQTPTAIIKLGDILRYVIYEANAEKVRLKMEIKLIEDYIDLQRIRSDNPQIEFVKELHDDERMISPLLFLPLIENGFKHGIKSRTDGFLRMKLRQTGHHLVFTSINNSCRQEDPEKAEYKGIGLDNVKRRLELSYPGRHELRFTKEKDIFRLFMRIDLT